MGIKHHVLGFSSCLADSGGCEILKFDLMLCVSSEKKNSLCLSPKVHLRSMVGLTSLPNTETGCRLYGTCLLSQGALMTSSSVVRLTLFFL